jgi:hypothetical protein
MIKQGVAHAPGHFERLVGVDTFFDARHTTENHKSVLKRRNAIVWAVQLL